MDAIRAFISYSHDSREHQLRILDLSERLRNDGIDCRIDQYQIHPRGGWPLWMEREIRDADHVMVVCTETYRQRFNGEEAEGVGFGAAYESTLTRGSIYASPTDSKFSKFLVVLLRRADRDFVPDVLLSAAQYCLEDDDGYDRLYRHIVGIPYAQMSQIGKPKTERSLPPLLGKPGFFSFKRDRVIHYPVTPPAQLPPSVIRPGSQRSNLPQLPAFVGRTNEVSAITEAIRNSSPVVALLGSLGVGKSSLLCACAHHVMKLGIHRLLVWLPTGSDGITLDDAYDEIARTADAAYIMRLVLDQKRAEVIRILSEVSTLLIVPHFERVTDPMIRKGLLSLSSSCHILLSTIGQSPADAFELKVSPLNNADALILARNEMGRNSSAAGHDFDLGALCTTCGNIPLAIQWTIASATDELGDKAFFAQPVQLEAPDEILKKTFVLCWDNLSAACRQVVLVLA